MPLVSLRSLLEDFPVTSAKALSLFHAAPYGGSRPPFATSAPWAGHDSVTGPAAGSSSSRSLIHQAGIPVPTVGSLYNGRASALFNPSASEGSGAMSATIAAVSGTNFTGTNTPYPFSLHASGVWVPDYPGTSWSSSASNGTSGSRNPLTSAGTGAPAQAAAQNGHIGADFSGGQALTSVDDITSFVTTTAGGFFCLIDSRSFVATTGTVYQDACIFTDLNFDIGISVSTSGIVAFAYDGLGATGYQTTAAQSLGAGFAAMMMRWDGTNLGLTIDSFNGEVTTSCSTLASLTGALVVGEGQGGLNAIDAVVEELWFLPFTPSRQNFLDYITYCDAQYSLSL